MPPNIIDIILKVIPQWLGSQVDIILRATPNFPAWMWSQVDIVLKATPAGFGLPLFMLTGGAIVVLGLSWWLMEDKNGC